MSFTLKFSSLAKDLARSSKALSSKAVGAVERVIIMLYQGLGSLKPVIAKMRRPTTSIGIFSEENRERFYRATEFTRKIVHYGWIPLIMLIGTLKCLIAILYSFVKFYLGYIRSDPRPSLLRLLNPLS